MRKALYPAILFVGLVGALLGATTAWSQTPCRPEFVGNPNFCHKTTDEASGAPSPPATDLQKPPQPTIRYPLHYTFIYLCHDRRDGHLLDCGFSIEILKHLDPDPAFSNAQNGGHIVSEHRSPHPLSEVEPKDKGDFLFAGLPGSSGTVVASPPNPPKMIGQTGQNVAVVLYPVPQASGDLLEESFIVSPPRYLCGPPGCFDQVPVRHGLNRMQFLWTLHVGVPVQGPLFTPLIQTPDAPFVLTGDKPEHPQNHFGTATALGLITQIAEAYLDNQPGCKDPVNRPNCAKLNINDLSLVRGGVYDLNKQWFGDNTTGNGHWGHRTGTEVDIDTKDSLENDTSCKTDSGGNDLAEEAVLEIIRKPLIPTFPQGSPQFLIPVSAFKCHGGNNHVYLQ
ncbi:MAG: hypothetical protein ACREII_02025 [Nitrospiraceae bacterium]